MPFAGIREKPGLFEILDRILDSGIVIEISERTAPDGIELINSQSRVTVASQETYRIIQKSAPAARAPRP